MDRPFDRLRLLLARPAAWKWTFVTCAALMLLIMVHASGDYGISWDDGIGKAYGDQVMRFYASGGKDKSYDDSGSGGALHLYGAFVEIVCGVANKMSSRDVYDVRHLVVALFGFAGLLFTGLTARTVAGWKTGVLALLLLFLTPTFFGHAMFNQKDIPFASCYIAAVFFLCRYLREFPKLKLSTGTGLAIASGLAIGVRIGGLLLFAYLFLVWATQVIRDFIARKKSGVERVRFAVVTAGRPLLVAFGGFVLGMLCWPYGLSDPLNHPLATLNQMSNFAQFDSLNLFDGRWIHRQEIPWFYLPKWMWITVPLFIHGALLALPLLCFPSIRRRLKLDYGNLALLGFVFSFPILYIIAKSSNVYDSWRHVLFVYPPLVVVCAAVWTRAISLLRPGGMQLVAAAALLATMVQPGLWMLRNHPFEPFYFNPLIGGIDGAFKRYEIDYWGTSIRQAVEWIAAHAKTNGGAPARVRCYYGDNESTAHWVSKYPNLTYVATRAQSPGWDFSIVLPAQAKHNPALLANWPPAGTVYQARADNTPIVAVVEQRRTEAAADVAQTIYQSTDVSYLIAQSLERYRAGEYAEAVAACERVLAMQPHNITALNNQCAALNQMKLYQEAASVAEVGLAVDPAFQLLRNNRQEALANVAAPVPPEVIAKSYIALSLVYYRLALYSRSVEFCQKALNYSPDSAIAYNNMCSAYNEMHDYGAAVAAGEKAYHLQPESALIRNNLDIARTGASQKSHEK